MLSERDRRTFKCRPDHLKVLICITMYQETFEQFLQSMAGVLRAIAELEHYDEWQFKDWIGVVVVADGSDKLPDDFKK